MEDDDIQQQQAQQPITVIDILEDVSTGSFAVAGFATITLVSFLGRVNSELAPGILLIFTCLNIAILVVGLVVGGMAIMNSQNYEDGVSMRAVVGIALPTIAALIISAMANLLGYHCGGGWQ